MPNRNKAKDTEAAPPEAATAAPTSLPEVDGSLEQAGAALRAEINAHRAKLNLLGAVETALTAKQALRRLEEQRKSVLTSLAASEERKARVDAQVTEATALLGNVNGQVADARKALDALTAQTVAERKLGETERQTQEGKHRAFLAEQDRELMAAKARLQEAKDELAAVASKYVGPVSVDV